MSADLALINAKVHTMNPDQPTAQAIAITKNKIVKVGTNSEINQYVNKNTKIISLEGKTVLPGLIDTHIHVADFGRCLMWLDLTTAESIFDLQSMLKQRQSKLRSANGLLGKDGTRTASNVYQQQRTWMKRPRIILWFFTVKPL